MTMSQLLKASSIRLAILAYLLAFLVLISSEWLFGSLKLKTLIIISAEIIPKTSYKASEKYGSISC